MTLRRIGALGDVHTEDVAVERALEFFARRELDAVLCVGDIVDGLGDVERTVSLLREGSVVCVAGNHERWALSGSMRDLPEATATLSDDAREWLAALPASRRLATVAGGLLLCHGVGEDDMAFLKSDTKGYALQGLFELFDLMKDPSIAFMLGGHTHERLVRPFQDLVVLNAGTLHRGQSPGVVELDFETREAVFFDLGETIEEASRHSF